MRSGAAPVKRLLPRRRGTRWLDFLKILACYRLVDPGSERRLHCHWYEDSALRDLLGSDRVIAGDTLYRCLNKLLAHNRDFFSFLRAVGDAVRRALRCPALRPDENADPKSALPGCTLTGRGRDAGFPVKW